MSPPTLAIAGFDDATRADPWFVRTTDYPAVGSQLAARHPLVLPSAHTATRGFRALVTDGVLGDRLVEQDAAAVDLG
jgi:hypothetical protein